MNKFITFYILISFGFLSSLNAQENNNQELISEVQITLEKGIEYFHSINIYGGYVYNYTLDLNERWHDDGLSDEHTIEIQPPGTPTVGTSFLRAYKITKNKKYLIAAKDAARTLIIGQNDLGGWNHQVHFNKPKDNIVSFDDNQTQSAIRFLMALDQIIEYDSLSVAVEKALVLMLTAQFDNGAWPHRYPKEGNTNDFATFNDGGINDCIEVMIDAHKYYGKEIYLKSIQNAGWFLFISQQAPPQTGWAQQYNAYLQPAWARDFEPASLSPRVTLNNIITLVDLYLYTKKTKHLKLIPDALRWIEGTRLPNGKWPRFVEIGTNKPLYYDNGRIRVNSFEELSLDRRTGYAYEIELESQLKVVIAKFEKVQKMGAKKFLEEKNRPLTNTELVSELEIIKPKIMKIIESQDAEGRWITKNDRYRKEILRTKWNGEYIIKDRVKSSTFNNNVNMLCYYLELQNKIEN